MSSWGNVARDERSDDEDEVEVEGEGEAGSKEGAPMSLVNGEVTGNEGRRDEMKGVRGSSTESKKAR